LIARIQRVGVNIVIALANLIRAWGLSIGRRRLHAPAKKLSVLTSACDFVCRWLPLEIAVVTQNQSHGLTWIFTLINADQQPGNWMSYAALTATALSPLNQINDQNVGQLALAWYVDLDTRRGQEATPVVVMASCNFTTAWSKVFAAKPAT